MSALKHGLFRAGFMPCDRCVLNAKCERFEPGSECVLEREAYDWIVKELMEQYSLEGIADEILASRAAMYLIRIARAETYESAVGVTDKSILWGKYISRLDNTLRGLMRDLAVTRAKRKEFEKGDELMVNLDDLLKKFVLKSERKAKELAQTQKPWMPQVHMKVLLKDWRKERRRLKLNIGRVEVADEEKEDS